MKSLILFLFLLFSPSFSSAASETLTVNEIRELDPTSGSFTIVGYISNRFTCPPCPEGSVCKPCMPDNVIVSETYDPDTKYTDHANHVTVLLPSNKKPEETELTVGRRYELTITVDSAATMNFGLQNFELQSYKPAPEKAATGAR